MGAFHSVSIIEPEPVHAVPVSSVDELLLLDKTEFTKNTTRNYAIIAFKRLARNFPGKFVKEIKDFCIYEKYRTRCTIVFSDDLSVEIWCPLADAPKWVIEDWMEQQT